MNEEIQKFIADLPADQGRKDELLNNFQTMGATTEFMELLRAALAESDQAVEQQYSDQLAEIRKFDEQAQAELEQANTQLEQALEELDKEADALYNDTMKELDSAALESTRSALQ